MKKRGGRNLQKTQILNRWRREEAETWRKIQNFQHMKKRGGRNLRKTSNSHETKKKREKNLLKYSKFFNR